MLEKLNSSLKDLEKSFMLSFREVLVESNNVKNELNKFEAYKLSNNISKSEVLSIAKTIEKLSIKNEFKLNLIKDFPEYFSSIRSKKK